MTRVGVDIGGTFTDGVLVDGGVARVEKVLSTPSDPSRGFVDALDRLAPTEVEQLVHATTIATNAVIERRGADAALLITEGFGDVLEIARQVRWQLYDLQTTKPPPLIPRRRCHEIPERLDYAGHVLEPLDEEAVARAAAELRQQGIDSIAVAFLHSYVNDAHERLAAEVVRDVHPEAVVSLSSAIAPEIREYFRTSTTVINAYVAPVVRGYLEALEERLRERRIRGRFHLMQSSGGIMTAETARERPVQLVESGPAAGVAAGAYFAGVAGYEDAITFDMGGTTAKAGLVLGGRPNVLSEFEVGAGSWSGSGLVKGSGYPIVGAVMDLVEVGAGGGSIAWVDAGGAMRVGPQSAGAEPGPACYGRGGTAPTITDANLVLGRLDAAYFLGGRLDLDAAAARRAVDTVARPLGLEAEVAAAGIVEIADATMIEAVKLVSVQRGHDPRDLVLVAFGGAGPVHAVRLAEELGLKAVVVPPSPGVASALGMLLTDLRQDVRVTRLQRLGDVRESELAALSDEVEARAAAALGDVDEVHPYVELRYVGQSWALRVPLDGSGLRAAFDAAHDAAYGYAVPEDDVEVVNVGVSALRRTAKPDLERVFRGRRAPPWRERRRAVWFGGGWVECPVVHRYALAPGDVVRGPGMIEEPDSATVVPPDWQAAAGAQGTLLLTRA